jgi:1,4-alpha-glucan branching enzyme
METGYLIPVLHCHLPYVRHPEHEEFLEEDWFYEAVAETYLPLLHVFQDLLRDGVPFRVTLSVSPTLCEMMTNDLLQRRCTRYLRRHVELAEREIERKRGTPFEANARLYRESYGRALESWEHWDRSLVRAFRALRDEGCVELIGSAATHALLPLLGSEEAVRAQVRVGLENFAKHFARRPEGFWLPECAYRPGLEEVLAEFGIRYFFLDTHGLLLAEPRPPHGVFAPLETPAGVLAFGRDVESSRQVWSAEEGMPGDPLYREFYRDLGYDGEEEYLRPYLPPGGERRYLGLKYHRITGDVPLDAKEPYDPEAAGERAVEHAGEFVRQRTGQVVRARRAAGIPPAIVAPYDAELFGHWWFEGPWFLDRVFRGIAEADGIACVTPGDYLSSPAMEDAQQAGRPALSSWGNGGYFEMWVNGDVDWMYPRLHEAEAELLEATRRAPDGLRVRALTQCARELLLAQAGDWAFLISAGSAREYARNRFEALMERFDRLLAQVRNGKVDERFLKACERHDDVFPELTCEVFGDAR